MSKTIQCHIKKNKDDLNSFIDLAKTTFGIDFSGWYEKGFWPDNYIPHYIVEDNQVISNCSGSTLDLHLDGKSYSALQIGTVMTDVHYRKKGYAKSIMAKLLDAYKDKEIIYLFANDDAKTFYQQFGFKAYKQYSHLWEYCCDTNSTKVRKLDINSQMTDRQLFIDQVKNAYVNPYFDLKQSEGLVAFYGSFVFPDHVYYIEDLKTILIAEESDGKLQLYDVISDKIPDMEAVVSAFITEPISEVVFHFTPPVALSGLIKSEVTDDGTFFIKTDLEIKIPYQYPLTKQA